MQGNSATIRHQRVARRRPPRALSVPSDEPAWMGYLLVIFMITLFLPKSVAVNLGSIALTPTLASALVLFPTLAFSGRIKYAWPDAVVLLFMFSTFYSTTQTSDPAVAIEAFGRRMLIGGVPYLVGRYVGSRPDVFNPFMRRLMTVMAVMAVLIVIESVFRFNIHQVFWGDVYSPHKNKRMGLTRAYGWSGHSIMLGVSYAVFVPVMLVAALEKMKNLGKLRWLKLGLLLLGVFCSLSTGAWMPALLAICLVVWDYFHFIKPGPRWLIMSFGSLSAYYLLEFASGRPLMRILMMEMHLSDPDAWYYRWRLYERVYEVMPGYEWFGHGLRIPEQITAGGQWSIDNNFLVVLMQWGRIGLTLWVAMGVAVLLYGWKAVWNAKDTPYRRVARAVMFAIVTVGLTQFSVAMFSTAEMLNYMFMGLGVGLAQGLARGPGKGPRRKPQPRKPQPRQPQRPETTEPQRPLAADPVTLRTVSDI